MAPKQIPFVENVTGSKNLHYRRDVPSDVRAVVGKTRWSESLRTAVPKEAARRARELAVEHDRIIAAARRPDPLTVLSTAEREKLDDAGGVDGYLRDLDERARDVKRLISDADYLRDLTRVGAPREVEFGFWSEPVAGEGSRGEEPDPEWARAEIAALEAKARAIREHIERESNLISKVERNLASTPALKEAVEAVPAAVVDSATVSAIFEAWKSARKARLPDNYGVVVRAFEQVHGAPLLSQITKAKVREFRDHLAASGLKESSAAGQFGRIKTLLRFAVSEGYIENSPGEGIAWHWSKEKASAAKVKARRTFSVPEVERLLAAAEALPKADHVKLDTAWFARLALYTGGRGEELAQLAPRDLTTINGVWCVKIHDEGDNKLKNASSLRTVPIHPWLIEAGFLNFVAARAGGKQLFATLKADKHGRLYGGMQRRLTLLIRKRARITDGRAVPHSFRHTFTDMLKLVDAPQYVQDQLSGRRTKGREVADDYGEGAQIVVLAYWIDQINPLDVRRTVSDFDEES